MRRHEGAQGSSLAALRSWPRTASRQTRFFHEFKTGTRVQRFIRFIRITPRKPSVRGGTQYNKTTGGRPMQPDIRETINHGTMTRFR